ncbi:MAG TPA: NUDIX domain-containing protein, partial [Rudaea sp.]
VKRILARYHGIRGWPGTASVQKQLWKKAEFHLPRERLVDYTQAIMDFGAAVCIHPRPLCEVCPIAERCVAYRDGLAATLPDRKPARERPRRQTMMMLLRDGAGRILFQRRPPVGVWAGLWSLPEADDPAAAEREVVQSRQLRVARVACAGARFTHTFSHYHLDITPLTFEVEAPSAIADNDDERWLLPSEAKELGLPSPVRKLIARIAEEG